MGFAESPHNPVAATMDMWELEEAREEKKPEKKSKTVEKDSKLVYP